MPKAPARDGKCRMSVRLSDQLSAGRVLEANELERDACINTFRFDRPNRPVGTTYQSSDKNIPRSRAAGISRQVIGGRLEPSVVDRACRAFARRRRLACVLIRVVDAFGRTNLPDGIQEFAALLLAYHIYPSVGVIAAISLIGVISRRGHGWWTKPIHILVGRLWNSSLADDGFNLSDGMLCEGFSRVGHEASCTAPPRILARALRAERSAKYCRTTSPKKGLPRPRRAAQRVKLAGRGLPRSVGKTPEMTIGCGVLPCGADVTPAPP